MANSPDDSSVPIVVGASAVGSDLNIRTRMLTAGNQSRWFKVRVVGGRSYSIFTTMPYAGGMDSITSDNLNIALPDTVITLFTACGIGSFASNDDAGGEPLPMLRASRVNFRATEEAGIAAGSDGDVFIEVRGFQGRYGFAFGITVLETTLFSPRWSTFGNFYSTWGFQNTTVQTVAGTLRVFESGNPAPIATATFTIQPNTVVFRDTRPSDLNIAVGKAGSVVFTHTGPLGSILMDGFITNESGVVFVTVPVAVGGRPQQR